MSYLIFALIFIAGLLIILLLSDKFNYGELLGFPLIIGLGYASFVMFFLDALKLGITYGHLVTVLVLTSLVAIATLGYLYVKKKRNLDFFKSQKVKLGDFSLPWLCFLGFGVYLVYGITLKCLYWPPAEFDSIEGYDLLAKAIAHEGTIANSILLNPTIVAGCGPRLLYPPLYASCNAICYMSGMESPKLITALFFISWLVIFYSLIKRFVSHTVAVIATFMMMIAPEMFANASFTLTNLPTAVYASTAVICFFIWREQKINGFLYLSIITLVFATWTRSDAIVFYPGIMAVLLYDTWKTRGLKNILLFGAISIVPFILWHFYLTAHIERQQDSFFIKSLFFDTHKLGDVFGAAWTMITNTSLYGIIFYVFIPVLLINVYFIYKRQDMLAFLTISFGGWLLYTMLFYQMKNTDGSLFASGGWMLSGYKRGMFSFVPLAVFYCATNRMAMLLYAKIQGWVSAG